MRQIGKAASASWVSHGTYVLDSHRLARGSLDAFVDDAKTATAKLLKHLVMTGNVVARHLGGLMLVAHGHCQLCGLSGGGQSQMRWSGCMGPWADSSNVEARVQRATTGRWITPGKVLKGDE